MNRDARKYVVFTVALVGLVIAAGTLASAQDAKDKKPATPPAEGQPGLPPGWSAEDMAAWVSAGTPGKPHELLKKYVGTWDCASQMWMGPAVTEPLNGTFTQTCKLIMDGRYVLCEMSGDFPGMGPYTGQGLLGYDNVSGKYVATWIDNQSTGIMNGVGELSKDGKSINWTYNYNCPIRKKPSTMRQVDEFGDNALTAFEAFTSDPKSGKEYRCMRAKVTKKP